jgi:glycosyltransferase involved in cell wall biosynthesis
MPTFNDEAFVQQAIADLRAQTYSDWKLLVVDDCSTDSTAARAKESAGEDRRIRVEAKGQNEGFLRRWRSGLVSLLQDGEVEFVALVSGDDRWHPNWLSNLVDRLQGDPSFGIAQSYVTVSWPCKSKILGREYEEIPTATPSSTVLNHLLIGYGAFLHGLYRRKTVEELLQFPDRYINSLWANENVFLAYLSRRWGLAVVPLFLHTKVKGLRPIRRREGHNFFSQDLWSPTRRLSLAWTCHEFLRREAKLGPWIDNQMLFRTPLFMLRIDLARYRAAGVISF